MTIIAGAFSLNEGIPLPQALEGELYRHVSRNAGDQRFEIHGQGFYLVKIDIGSFGESALLQDERGSVTAVAGEPLVRDGDGVPNWHRGWDVLCLHRELVRGSRDILRHCRGNYCGVHYEAPSRTLTLFVDPTGVRPLYLWVGREYAIFASALRILEALEQVPKRLDLRGVAEIVAFNVPLADRTPYLDITSLRAGQLVTLGQGRVRRSLYLRWDGPIDRDTTVRDAVDKAHAAFMAAIGRRQRGSQVAAAFLSGGLDSRAIVGGLHAAGTAVHTVNFGPDGSQDRVFAAQLADKLGCAHTQLQTTADNVGQEYRKHAVSQWLSGVFPGQRAIPPMWSGDGGSVALGHVHITREIADALHRGDLTAAVALFTKGVPRRILQPGMRNCLLALPTQGILDELATIDSPDRARAFHLFLMLNDQRRHLVRHFDDIDLERIEFQLPFFDAEFLGSILRLPNEPMMFHRFYMDWLARFPNGLVETPWQHYPGHVAGPATDAQGLKYQWRDYYDHAMLRQMRSATVREGWSLLRDQAFPHSLLRRAVLGAAVAMTGLNIGDYRYLIRTALIFQRYWRHCSGNG